jgi:mRNA interferase MazF
MYMTHYDFGDVVLVQFPFTNQMASKQRPAVTVSSRGYSETKPDIIIMAITSQLRPAASFGDLMIEDWRGAQLLKPSAIKPVIATVERSIILRSLGTLQPMDQAALRAMMRSILG